MLTPGVPGAASLGASEAATAGGAAAEAARSHGAWPLLRDAANCKVSSSNEPGEGEHKLIRLKRHGSKSIACRNEAAKLGEDEVRRCLLLHSPACQAKERHVIIGTDADLSLALMSMTYVARSHMPRAFVQPLAPCFTAFHRGSCCHWPCFAVRGMSRWLAAKSRSTHRAGCWPCGCATRQVADAIQRLGGAFWRERSHIS